MANDRVASVRLRADELVSEQISRLIPALRPGEPAYEFIGRLLSWNPRGGVAGGSLHDGRAA